MQINNKIYILEDFLEEHTNRVRKETVSNKKINIDLQDFPDDRVILPRINVLIS